MRRNTQDPHGGDGPRAADPPPRHVGWGCLHWGLGSVGPASHAGGLHVSTDTAKPAILLQGGKVGHIS